MNCPTQPTKEGPLPYAGRDDVENLISTDGHHDVLNHDHAPQDSTHLSLGT